MMRSGNESRMFGMVGLSALAAALLSGTPARAQDLTPRVGPQTRPIVLTRVDVYPVDAPMIADGAVIFDGGKIAWVGPRSALRAPTNAQLIEEPLDREHADARLRVYPGLISAFTRIGLEEIGALRPSADIRETGDVKPEVIAATAVNPDSWLMPVARTNGVLAFGVFPSGGSIPGHASVISADGWTVEDITVVRDAGLVVAWPYLRVVRASWMDQNDEEQSKRIRESQERIASAFKTARAYIAGKDADAGALTDLRWEGMRSVLGPARDAGAKAAPDAKAAEPRSGSAKPAQGKTAEAQAADFKRTIGDGRKITFIEAQEYDQIIAAVALARREHLRLVLIGGRDAVHAAQPINDIGAKVMVNSVITMPRRDDSPYDEFFSLPARLKDAGIPFCIASGEETPHERNLPYAAALAAGHGLANADALRAVTLSAAECLGAEQHLGSITPGKDATLIVTDGDPLDVQTRTLSAYILGRPIDLSNKQTVLAAKYREKYRQMKEEGKKKGNGEQGTGNGEEKK